MRYVGFGLGLASLIAAAAFGRQAFGEEGMVAAIFIWGLAGMGGILLAEREPKRRR